MNRYLIKLGNREARPGHRVDCAQVEVEVEVDAASPEAAIKRVVQRMGHDTGGMALLDQGRRYLAVRIRVAPDRIRVKDVKFVGKLS